MPDTNSGFLTLIQTALPCDTALNSERDKKEARSLVPRKWSESVLWKFLIVRSKGNPLPNVLKEEFMEEFQQIRT